MGSAGPGWEGPHCVKPTQPGGPALTNWELPMQLLLTPCYWVASVTFGVGYGVTPEAAMSVCPSAEKM